MKLPHFSQSDALCSVVYSERRVLLYMLHVNVFSCLMKHHIVDEMIFTADESL